jgi:protease I
MRKCFVLLITVFLIAGCNSRHTNTQGVAMENVTAKAVDVPRKAVVLTADQFEDMEVYFPVFRLQEAGWKVTIAAPTMEPIYGEHGYGLEPDVTIDKVNPDDYDLLIIPGGSPLGAPSTVRKMKHAQEIARSFVAKNKPVAAICHGPYTLISAGVVKGRHLTSYWHDGVPEEIKKGGGVWEDKEVVVDGNLVSSRWPMDLPAFMKEVMIVVGNNHSAAASNRQ